MISLKEGTEGLGVASKLAALACFALSHRAGVFALREPAANASGMA